MPRRRGTSTSVTAAAFHIGTATTTVGAATTAVLSAPCGCVGDFTQPSVSAEPISFCTHGDELQVDESNPFKARDAEVEVAQRIAKESTDKTIEDAPEARFDCLR